MDLKPVPMSRFNETLRQSQEYLTEYFRSSSVSTVASKAYATVRDILLRRLSHSPFISEYNWPLLPSWDMSIDLSDDEYFRRYYEIVTEFNGARDYYMSGSVDMEDVSLAF